MALVKPAPLLIPFCNSGNKDALPSGPDLNAANQETGYPQNQQKKLSSGGVPVKRTETNGIFNFYSNYILWQQAGGMPTFEQTLSDQHGGYPAGIILFAASNNTFQLSLINSNTFNFITTPSFLDDGVHWKKVAGNASADFPDITDYGGVVTITGAGGLYVEKELLVGNTGKFFDAGTGARLQISRSTNTAGGQTFYIDAENNANGTAGGAGSTALISANGLNTLNAAYNNTDGRWYMPTATAGVVNAAKALAIFDDLPKTQMFTHNDSLGYAWNLICTDLTGKGFPSSKFLIQITSNNLVVLSGITFVVIDLIAAGAGTSGGVAVILSPFAVNGDQISFRNNIASLTFQVDRSKIHINVNNISLTPFAFSLQSYATAI